MLQNEDIEAEMRIEGGQVSPKSDIDSDEIDVELPNNGFDDRLKPFTFTSPHKRESSACLTDHDEQKYDVADSGSTQQKLLTPIKKVPNTNKQLQDIHSFLAQSMMQAGGPVNSDHSPFIISKTGSDRHSMSSGKSNDGNEVVEYQAKSPNTNRLLLMMARRKEKEQAQQLRTAALLTHSEERQQARAAEEVPFKFLDKREKMPKRGQNQEEKQSRQSSQRLQAEFTGSTMVGKSSANFDSEDSASLTQAPSETGSFFVRGQLPADQHHNQLLLNSQLDTITSFLANNSVDATHETTTNNIESQNKALLMQRLRNSQPKLSLRHQLAAKK